MLGEVRSRMECIEWRQMSCCALIEAANKEIADLRCGSDFKKTLQRRPAGRRRHGEAGSQRRDQAGWDDDLVRAAIRVRSRIGSPGFGLAKQGGAVLRPGAAGRQLARNLLALQSRRRRSFRIYDGGRRPIPDGAMVVCENGLSFQAMVSRRGKFDREPDAASQQRRVFELEGQAHRDAGFDAPDDAPASVVTVHGSAAADEAAAGLTEDHPLQPDYSWSCCWRPLRNRGRSASFNL